MNKRLEKIFSPEKLREKWRKKPASETNKIQSTDFKKKADIQDEFTRISHLILDKYNGDKREILKILLNDIKKGLDEVAATGNENSQSTASGFAVIEQINQLEDLIEAF